MKKIGNLLLASVLGGAITLGSYQLIFDKEAIPATFTASPNENSFLPVSNSNLYGTNVDFTEAAEKTVHAVVHVKNVAVFKGPRSIWEYYQYGNSGGRALQGSGSGVIITPDGYIVTNNHVIDGANELEVTLNNNQTYKAEVIGTDKISDIALIKVDAENLEYIPFGDSDNTKLGEWVLAVGNPFNLKSTVTAGIISAKARDLNVQDNSPQSFIQTDAAINPGNSGGALVNINGELIGINTAITSPSGSYIGYAFAVPSNNARKIVEDIIEFGDVQQGILGIRGGSTINISPDIKAEYNVNTAQGVFVSEVTLGSGAQKAGIKTGDVIRKIDNIDIKSFSELTGYINSKRPGDKVLVKVLRDGDEKEINVELTKNEIYVASMLGLEFKNATKEELKKFKTDNGVFINGTTMKNLPENELVGSLVTQVNSKKVGSIDDIKNALANRDTGDPIYIKYLDKTGKEQSMLWQ
ncbi:trypsin-like peptidase domain-containing protein [Gramella sp. AN32]|uniref:S1C family serine protease n=1 Tax=Christiangramia antarctica TaxID=2058158 RepID=A0ABW5X5A7_9FLAO|nr:trypsin-like peptidase domain-containing protein [Gramella sp. AN32]MCM4157911.1 serine protease [Gramella sp. AN32]